MELGDDLEFLTIVLRKLFRFIKMKWFCTAKIRGRFPILFPCRSFSILMLAACTALLFDKITIESSSNCDLFRKYTKFWTDEFDFDESVYDGDRV